METDDLRGLTNEELTEELEDSHRTLMKLRFSMTTMQTTNVQELKNVRKRIARINTIIRERELAKATI